MRLKSLLRLHQQPFQVIPWRRVLEYSRLARSLLTKMTLLVLDRVTKESSINIYLFLREVYRIGRSSGWLFCALYLKQSTSSLKIAYGGVFSKTLPLSCPISLTGKGYPRIIPRHVRTLMYKHDDRSDRLVRFYLSLFSFYTCIELAAEVSKKTYSSITSPILDYRTIYSWMDQFQKSFQTIVDRYIPCIFSLPLHQGMTWDPSWKSLPTYSVTKNILWQLFPTLLKKKSFFFQQHLELAAYSFYIEFFREEHPPEKRVYQSCILFPQRTRYAGDLGNVEASVVDDAHFNDFIYPFLDTWNSTFLGDPVGGRLSQQVEGGGKRRVFAIGNWVTQRLLSPIHDWLAQILSGIPMDGTFDQPAPLNRLRGSRHNYCYDLTAATDRWPLVFLELIMSLFFGSQFSAAVVRSALGDHLFSCQSLQKDKRTEHRDDDLACHRVFFSAGQPLGYKCSWPLFALSHHMVIWWCAEQVRPGTYFDRYALLGDDVVISDPLVAEAYCKVLKVLQVQISAGKTLISHTGCAEFAKLFRVKDLERDCSPVSFKALLGVHHVMNRVSLSYKYPVLRYSTFLRLGGSGYRSCSRNPSRIDRSFEPTKVPKMVDLAWVSLRQPTIELFLGQGRFLPPDIYWYVFRKIHNYNRPKPMLEIPPTLIEDEEELWFLEYTSLRTHVGNWLKHLFWSTKIDEFLIRGTHYLSNADQSLWSKVNLNFIAEAPIQFSGWEYSPKIIDLGSTSFLFKLAGNLPTIPVLSLSPGVVRGPPETPDWCLCTHNALRFGDISNNSFLVWQKGLIIHSAVSCEWCPLRVKLTAT